MAEGTAEGAATTEGATGTTEGTNGAPATQPSWYAPAESLKTSHPEIWTSFENGIKSGAIKDLPSLVVKGISAEKKLGGALTLPGKDKPEELKNFKSKLTAGGVDLRALASEAPETPDKYDIKLDAIPEPLRSEEVVTALRGWAHKHGLSNDAVAELVGIEAERYATVVEPALKYTREQGEQAVNDFAKEVGKEPAEIRRWGGAWLAKNFTEEDMIFFDKTGFSNSPPALKFAARAGLDTGEDISVIDGSGTAVDNEYEDLMKNLGDPNHVDYKMYNAIGIDPQDPKRIAFMAKREQILQRKFGKGEGQQ